MHRRAFIASLAATTLLPRSLSAQTPTASPAATPVTGSVRPSPVDLGSDVALVDYRIHPGETVGIIGELRNDSDQMIDAPVVSISWPSPGNIDSFLWLSPLIPVIEASGSVPVYGSVPNGEEAEAMLAEPSFALCSPVEPGEYTELAAGMELEINPVDEVTSPEVYRLAGTLTNTGTAIARHVELRGVVRDADGRVAGMANSIYYAALGIGRSTSFSIYAYADPQYSNNLNPFPLLGGTAYTTEVLAGIRGPLTLPGCQFGLPWE